MDQHWLRQLIPLRHESYKQTRNRRKTILRPRKKFICFNVDCPEVYTLFVLRRWSNASVKARKLYGWGRETVCYEYTSITDGYTWERVL